VFVAREMAHAGVSSTLALLLTSELASNVVQHARTTFELVVDATAARIRVEIHDGLRVTAALRELIERHPGLPAVHVVNGRGLLLLTSSANACGVFGKGEPGKAGWFEVVPASP
jgi:hypothetical protein